MDKLAPIVVFVYNRPNCAKWTLEALRKCTLAEDSELFIYSDAPKDDKNIESVKEVRNIIHAVDGFKQIKIIERDRNMGLSESIITGVTELVNRYGKVIVVEDDLIVNSGFLEYMNEALRKYENNKQVMSITAYSYTNKYARKLNDTYFLPLSSSWTWGTWKDRWNKFDADAGGWEELKTNKALRKKFDFCGCTGFYAMLLKQMEEKSIDSWAIRWYWTVFQKNGLTLYPKETMVNNEGYENGGVHCRGTNDAYAIFDNNIKLELTDDVQVSKQACRVVKMNLWYRNLKRIAFALLKKCKVLAEIIYVWNIWNI